MERGNFYFSRGTEMECFLFCFFCVCVCVFLHYQLEKAVLPIPPHDLKICDSRFSAVMHTTAINVT